MLMLQRVALPSSRLCTRVVTSSPRSSQGVVCQGELGAPATAADRVAGSIALSRSHPSYAQPTFLRAAAAVEVYKGDLLNKSYYPTSADASNATKRWYVIDAEGQTLGRLATLAATYIRSVISMCMG